MEIQGGRGRGVSAGANIKFIDAGKNDKREKGEKRGKMP